VITPAQLSHVYWIGGGSGAGKSTIARRLAVEHGMQLYVTDEVMSDHTRRSTADEAPYLHRFIEMSMDERWVNRSPQDMLDSFHWFRGEGFGLIVEDLVALPSDRPIVVEGFRLLPELVAPLLGPHRHGVWLVPTPEFRRAALESRGGLWSIAGKTTDPDRALANLLERERMFTARMVTDAERLGLPIITVDATMSEGELTERVSAAVGLD
jgi:2-phosphoglycerate kinase